MPETRVWSLGQEDPLEKEMATHSNTLAWKILWATIQGVVKSQTRLSDFTFTFIHTNSFFNSKFIYCFLNNMSHLLFCLFGYINLFNLEVIEIITVIVTHCTGKIIGSTDRLSHVSKATKFMSNCLWYNSYEIGTN